MKTTLHVHVHAHPVQMQQMQASLPVFCFLQSFYSGAAISSFPAADLENLKGGVHRGQLDRRGFTTPINYNGRLLTSIRALSLADVSLVHFAMR